MFGRLNAEEKANREALHQSQMNNMKSTSDALQGLVTQIQTTTSNLKKKVDTEIRRVLEIDANEDVTDYLAVKKWLEGNPSEDAVKKGEVTNLLITLADIEAQCTQVSRFLNNSVVAAEELEKLDFSNPKNKDAEIFQNNYAALGAAHTQVGKIITRINKQVDAINTGVKENATANNSSSSQSRFTNSLSQRIAYLTNQAYSPSTLTIWSRRLALVGLGLTVGITAYALITVIMSPTATIKSFGAGLISTLAMGFKSLAAFFYLTPQPSMVMHSTINAMGMQFKVNTPIPVTTNLMGPMNMAIAPVMSRNWLKRKTISPDKEMAALQTQMATFQGLALELSQKIATLTLNDEVKFFLSCVVKEALNMNQRGGTKIFAEEQNNTLKKARLLLHATAKVVEGDSTYESVQDLLSQQISGYKYGEIINLNRYTPSFFKRSQTTIAKNLTAQLVVYKTQKIQETQEKSAGELSFDEQVILPIEFAKTDVSLDEVYKTVVPSAA